MIYECDTIGKTIDKDFCDECYRIIRGRDDFRVKQELFRLLISRYDFTHHEAIYDLLVTFVEMSFDDAYINEAGFLHPTDKLLKLMLDIMVATCNLIINCKE